MVKVEHCPCCGQILPPAIALPGIKQRIYDYVARHPEGVTRQQVADYAYAERTDGGPLTSNSCISVHINQINKKWLASLGLRIRGRGGPGSTFTLRAL